MTVKRRIPWILMLFLAFPCMEPSHPGSPLTTDLPSPLSSPHRASRTPLPYPHQTSWPQASGGGSCCRIGLWTGRLDIHYITDVFKSWNIILVSHHIHRTEICRILPSVRRELRNMIEGDRAASRPLCQSPVNVIVIPLISMLKTVNHCSPASWENHSLPWYTFE